MAKPLIRKISGVICSLLIFQLLLPAQACLNQRIDVLEEREGYISEPHYFQSTTDGNFILVTNTRLVDRAGRVHLFDRDLNVLNTQAYPIEWDGLIVDLQPRASGGYLGVINTPTIHNAFSTYSIFLMEDASSPENNIIYTSNPEEARREVSNILSVEDSILFISGTKYGEWGVTADSSFLEKRVNNETVWQHTRRGGFLLGLDGDADSLNLLVARDTSVEVITIAGETGDISSTYLASLNGHRFPPLIFRDLETNTTYLAKFTETYEISSFSPSGANWTYHKEQTLTTSSIDRILDVEFDSEGFIYLNGIFYNEENASGILLTKLSPEGELIWEKRYDNEGELSASASRSVIDGEIIYLSALKPNQAGAWNQFVLAFSLEDGQLLKECSLIEQDDHRFSTKGISVFEGMVYTFGAYSDRTTPVLSLRTFDFSDLTSAEDVPSSFTASNIKVYPNPSDSRGQLSVELPLPHQLAQIRVVGVKGEEVALYPLSANQSTLRISGLTTGTYVLLANDKAGKIVARQRVVVQ